MAEQSATESSEAYKEFEQADGIEINTHPSDRILVKVMREDAIGQFYRICREYDVKRRSTTRNGLGYTVMDSWVDFSNE